MDLPNPGTHRRSADPLPNLIQPQVVAKLADVCFDKCVSKPGASLDRYESACLSQCALRYLETGQLIMSRISGGEYELDCSGGYFNAGSIRM